MEIIAIMYKIITSIQEQFIQQFDIDQFEIELSENKGILRLYSCKT
jgi:hypothetical protein